MSSSAGVGEPRRSFRVDERLVAPESRYEVEDGKVVYVAPSDEPHGSRHSKISALLEAHVAADYDVARDMLTRTSEIADIAPDASVFPAARDPVTGGRRIEELAFQVVSTEKLTDAGRKAQKLIGRGVRRVFAVDVARTRVFEWSAELGTWQILSNQAAIEDRCLAAPLPIEALVLAAKADDAMARALLAKQNSVLMAALDEGRNEGKAEGKAEAVISILNARGLPLPPDVRQRILSTRDPARLERLLALAATCTDTGVLVEDESSPRR
ncbi:MAG: Uma2 family endonuclease [Deltaproteobacteria bacterium]|nr:Uma2 family endonuclease [Deltaproteobacteria bacterium]